MNLLWVWKGLLPSIKFTDDKGNTLRARNGQILEIGFVDVDGSRRRQALGWIATGVKVAAVAFAIWLNAGIAFSELLSDIIGLFSEISQILTLWLS